MLYDTLIHWDLIHHWRHQLLLRRVSLRCQPIHQRVSGAFLCNCEPASAIYANPSACGGSTQYYRFAHEYSAASGGMNRKRRSIQPTTGEEFCPRGLTACNVGEGGYEVSFQDLYYAQADKLTEVVFRRIFRAGSMRWMLERRMARSSGNRQGHQVSRPEVLITYM